MRNRGFCAGKTNHLRHCRQQQSNKTSAPSIRKQEEKPNNNKPQGDTSRVVKTVNLEKYLNKQASKRGGGK